MPSWCKQNQKQSCTMKENRSRYLSDLLPIKCWFDSELAALKRLPYNFAKLKYYFLLDFNRLPRDSPFKKMDDCIDK